jgi:uncharacterized membrane protein
MKHLTITSAGVTLLAAIAIACSGDLPSAAPSADPNLAKGGGSAPYTVLDVGALLGGSSSEAHGVNDAGDVVGFYSTGGSFYPFALVSGAPVTLGGGSGWAWGISNGSPAFVAGNSAGMPARWSLADPTQATLLARTAAEVTAGSGGLAKGVNGAGDAVGYVGSNAAMWLADGSRVTIANPTGYARGEGRGIDDDGLAVFQFFTGPSETSVARAFLRLTSGALVELPPEGADVTTFANDISELTNGQVYVAGSTQSNAQAARSVRWSVDATTGGILATTVVSSLVSHGLGVSDAGGIAGFVEDGDRSLRMYAYLWRGADLLKLNAPKGGKDAQAWAMSRSGQYVAGHAIFSGLASGAVRWTIAAP